MKQEEIFIISMRRSGQHAIIRWLESIIGDGRYRSFNNVTKKLYRAQKLAYASNPVKKVWDEDYLIYNSEDRRIRDAKKIAREHIRRDTYGYRLRDPQKIVIVRSHFNLFASRLKSQKTKKSITIDLGAMTEDTTKCYIDHCSVMTNPDYTFIVYDKWFTSKEYRKKIASKLGLEGNLDKEEINSVPDYGKGSSFNGLEFDGNAQKMDVLNRYEAYLDSKKYINYVTQDSLMECYKNIFGEDETYNKFMELK